MRVRRRERERKRHVRRVWIGVLGCLATLTAATWASVAAFSPWPVGVTLRHIYAAPSCDRARTAGLAPSYRGQPGYWERHDYDNNGVACEPPSY